MFPASNASSPMSRSAPGRPSRRCRRPISHHRRRSARGGAARRRRRARRLRCRSSDPPRLTDRNRLDSIPHRHPRPNPRGERGIKLTELPDDCNLEQCAAFLRELATHDSPLLPIGEAALALAAFDRPRVALGRYRQHLATIARDVGRHSGAQGDLAARARALNEIILLKHGYSGDELTYDDLQNANLTRVVDRRKGLPVALGILYLHAARAQGWESVGLAFPGHFLIRLGDGPERLILDPFHGG